jgi:hypothetical protein
MAHASVGGLSAMARHSGLTSLRLSTTRPLIPLFNKAAA